MCGTLGAVRALVIQQDDDTPVGTIGDAADASGFTLEVVRARDGLFPGLSGIDLVIPLGSASMVGDLEHQEWIQPQLAFLRAAQAAGVPQFGICFGCQALAAALGGHVYRLPALEVGWQLVDQTGPMAIDAGPWFEWHWDAVQPPPSAELLAANSVCVQAWRLGRTLAVQFHPEVTPSIVDAWVSSVAADHFDGQRTSSAEILAATDANAAGSAGRSHELFSTFLATLGDHADPAGTRGTHERNRV